MEKRMMPLYVASLVSLIVHEIDSAYWHEWTVFGLPGGIQLFLALHLVLVPPFLVGLVRLARDVRAGVPYGIVLSVAGIAGVTIHSALLLRGGAEFRNPTSVGVLVLMFATCVALLLDSLAVRRGATSANGRPTRRDVAEG